MTVTTDPLVAHLDGACEYGPLAVIGLNAATQRVTHNEVPVTTYTAYVPSFGFHTLPNSHVVNDTAVESRGVRTPWITNDYYVVTDKNDVPHEQRGMATAALAWLNSGRELDNPTDEPLAVDDRLLVRDTETGLMDIMTIEEIWEKWLDESEEAYQPLDPTQSVWVAVPGEPELQEARFIEFIGDPLVNIAMCAQLLSTDETTWVPLGCYALKPIPRETDEYKLLTSDDISTDDHHMAHHILSTAVRTEADVDHTLTVLDKATGHLLALNTEEIILQYTTGVTE